MLYEALRPLLFRLDPETAHHLTLSALRAAEGAGLVRGAAPSAGRPVRAMGLDFPNAVGLAAGLDKNAECVDGLAALGFGFIEVGTVTPRPQPGNPKPRLFRIPPAGALVNRMGFNNAGIDALLVRLARCRYRGILGINIGKNFDTPLERAADDYLECLRKAWTSASYVAVNISSPNTAGLRDLQGGDELDRLLAALKREQEALARRHGRHVPLAVKIAPDLAEEELRGIGRRLVAHGIEGVIATNTTVSREGVEGLPAADERGGLSGAPLAQRATRALQVLAAELAGRVPIIGVGGIMSGADAREKIRAGATLVQIYTGLVYRGPELVREAVQALSEPAAKAA